MNLGYVFFYQKDDVTKKAPSRHKNAVVQEEYVIGQTKSVSKRHARAAGTNSALKQHARAASKFSSKGKERSKVTACYLDGIPYAFILLS